MGLKDMPWDLEHGTREAQPVFGGCYSGQRDLAERRWRVHGSHQDRQVVGRVDRLETRHLASQAVVHE